MRWFKNVIGTVLVMLNGACSASAEKYEAYRYLSENLVESDNYEIKKQVDRMEYNGIRVTVVIRHGNYPGFRREAVKVFR